MAVLYSGTDKYLYENILEMLYQMHISYEDKRVTFNEEGMQITLYQINVSVENMNGAVSILADMTTRVSKLR